jgi:hypothetical protein
MAIDPLWIWIALGAVAVLVVVGLVSRGARRSRSASLREKFGNEYDHVVQERGSRTKAERELLARSEEVEKYNIRPLQAGEREQYRRDWERVEKQFVERPAMAVVEADELVAVIMRAQGYPMGDFDKHAAHLSVRHPRVVEHYREGHKVMDGTPGNASTEDLRQAMLHYRALFDELLGSGTMSMSATDVPRDIPRGNEVIAPSTRVSEPKLSDEERRREADRRRRDEERLLDEDRGFRGQ